VVRATGIEPPIPDRLAAALDGEERYELVADDLDEVKSQVRAAVTR
jgi:hypothetical protein